MCVKLWVLESPGKVWEIFATREWEPWLLVRITMEQEMTNILRVLSAQRPSRWRIFDVFFCFNDFLLCINYRTFCVESSENWVTTCMENLEMLGNLTLIWVDQMVKDISVGISCCLLSFHLLTSCLVIHQWLVDRCMPSCVAWFNDFFCRICTDICSILVALTVLYVWCGNTTWVGVPWRVRDMSGNITVPGEWSHCMKH